MGLKDYKKYRKKQEYLEFLAEYGITEQDLKELKTFLSYKRNAKIEKTNQNQDEKPYPTAGELVSIFAQETEELFPNG
jgi:hypothetical protein